MRAPIGLRIRNYRKIKGLSQASLAKSISISPSYLNLIEANKRDVGGKLLHLLAQELDVDLHDLTGESETRLINELREAFADPLLAAQNLSHEDAHLMVAQLPRMARALHTCYRGYLDASASASALANRLNADPLFSQLLHQMLSQITAIRSTAEILRDVPDMEQDLRTNFDNSVFEQSRSLTDVAHSLIAQFDKEVKQHHSSSPLREVNDLIIGENNYFPRLESAATKLRMEYGLKTPPTEDRLQHLLSDLQQNTDMKDPVAPFQNEQPGRGDTPENSYDKQNELPPAQATRRFQLTRKIVALKCSTILREMTNDPRLTSAEAKEIAIRALNSYCAGAILFPYHEFLKDAQRSMYDVDFLAQLYGGSFEQIAHRLVTLRAPDAHGIPFGFLRTDPSGFLTKQFPLPGLLMPNAGHACPLWVIYRSAQSPNQVMRQIVSFTDGSRYLFIAKTSIKRVETFNNTSVFSTVMLACNLMQADQTTYANSLRLDRPEHDTPVGPACNLCVRQQCAHRNTPTAATQLN